MKRLVRFFALGMLTGCLALQAQNFNGSDDFSTVTGSWTDGSTTGGAAFGVSGNVLNFTDPILAGGASSSAVRYWSLNSGSSLADWQVQIDLTLSLLQVASQITNWTLILTNSGDPTGDSARLNFQQSYMGPLSRNITGGIITNSSGGMTMPTTISGTTVTVRASYIAASHLLSLDYSQGAGFFNVTSANIDSGLSNWEMSGSDYFNLSLLASNLTNAGATLATTTGVYADNFVASPTAPIPEPSTYAAAFGVLALLAAGLKRRFGQQ